MALWEPLKLEHFNYITVRNGLRTFLTLLKPGLHCDLLIFTSAPFVFQVLISFFRIVGGETVWFPTLLFIFSTGWVKQLGPGNYTLYIYVYYIPAVGDETVGATFSNFGGGNFLNEINEKMTTFYLE